MGCCLTNESLVLEVGGEGVLGLISELNDQDLVAVESDDYTASTDSNMSSCSESSMAGMQLFGGVKGGSVCSFVEQYLLSDWNLQVEIMGKFLRVSKFCILPETDGSRQEKDNDP